MTAVKIQCHVAKKYTPPDCFFGDFPYWEMDQIGLKKIHVHMIHSDYTGPGWNVLICFCWLRWINWEFCYLLFWHSSR